MALSETAAQRRVKKGIFFNSGFWEGQGFWMNYFCKKISFKQTGEGSYLVLKHRRMLSKPEILVLALIGAQWGTLPAWDMLGPGALGN